MRISAEQLSRSTWVLLIGVGEYQIEGPAALFAADDVQRLRHVLTDPAACGIPAEQVVALLDREATPERVEHELRQMAAQVDSQSILLVFFTGHGHRFQDRFFFHLYDTDPNRLPETGLSAGRLAEFLEGAPARGILVVADCCVGAGFAETAPEFFFDLGGKDFRIALAASRADQPSWELEGDRGSLFTKHFVRILEGRSAASQRPGEITYLSLVEGLTFAINEDLAQRHPDTPQQELVANGSTASDPLLFMSARAAMKGVTVQTHRVSREHLRRVLVRSAIGLAAALLLAVGLYSAWMGAHEYAIADARETQLVRGYPGWSGFGFPIPLHRLAYSASDYRTDGPLSHNRPLVTLGPGTVRSQLAEELNPVLRASLLAQRGEIEAARELLLQAPGRPPLDLPTPTLQVMALALRVRLATPPQVPRLVQRITSYPEEVKRSALLALFDLAPDTILRILEDDLRQESPSLDHREALLQLDGSCSQATLSYLRTLAASPGVFNYGNHLLAAWWRVECPLETGDLREVVTGLEYELVERVGLWAQLLGYRTPRSILDETEIDLARRVSFALGWPQLPCQEQWFAAPPPEEPFVRIQLLRHALASCPGTAVQVTASPQRLLLVLERHSRPLSGFRVEIPAPLTSYRHPAALAIRSTLRLLTDLQSREASPFLIEQILRGDVSLVATPALETARRVGIPWQPGQAFIRGGNEQHLALQYYLWLRRGSAESADKIAFDRLGDGRAGYFDRYFALVGITPSTLEALLRHLDERKNSRSEAISDVLAMFGDAAVLNRLASDHDTAIRESLASHGPFNEVLGDWLAASEDDLNLLVATDGLKNVLAYLASLQAELKALAPEARCLRLELELDSDGYRGFLGQRQSLPPGIRFRLQREIEECRTSSDEPRSS